jgi:hypothetical protein
MAAAHSGFAQAVARTFGVSEVYAPCAAFALVVLPWIALWIAFSPGIRHAREVERIDWHAETPVSVRSFWDQTPAAETQAEANASGGCSALMFAFIGWVVGIFVLWRAVTGR